MPKSRDANFVSAVDFPDAINQLNFILSRLADRIDRLEGLREEFQSDQGGNFDGALTAHTIEIHDENMTIIHSLGST